PNDLALLAWRRGLARPAGLPARRIAPTGEILVTGHAGALLAVYSVVLLLLAIPLGRAIANVMEGRFRFLGRIESGLYRLCGIRAEVDMNWLHYALGVLLFNGIGVLVV